MKRFNVMLLVLGAGFLAYLVWTIGLAELAREVVSLGWGLIPLVLCEGFAEFIHVVGWRHCLSGPLRSIPMLHLFRIRLAGYAINYLTPTAAIGGEVTKAVLLADHRRGPEAATGVLIGKLCFGFAHVLFVVIGSILTLWRIHLPRTLWLGMIISGSLVAGGMVTFLLVQKHGKLGALVRWLVARKVGGSMLKQAAQGITEVDESLKVFFRERPTDLLRAVAWHQFGYSVGILQTWFFFSLLHKDVSWTVAAGIWFLGMWFDLLTFAIPMNAGTLEGTRIVALGALGYNSLIGMTYGVALRLAQLFWSLVGLLAYGELTSPRVRQRAAVHPPGRLPHSRCEVSSPKNLLMKSKPIANSFLIE
jgi:hypothetical protein